MILLLACTQILPAPPDGPQGLDEDTGADVDDSAATDSAPADTDDTQDTDDTDDTDERDYSQPGTFSVSTSSRTVSTSCAMSVTLYEPAGGSERLVVLAHGFARSPTNVSGWAEHWASHGVTVATPSLCHAMPWDADHVQNGADLADLAASMSYEEIVYAGHSAGGLASLLAAAQDARATAWVGLDPTDADGLGAAVSVSIPTTAILGEPSDCNGSGNGVDLADDTTQISGADHCDFESPTDALCTSFCPDAGGDVHDEILTLSTEAVLR